MSSDDVFQYKLITIIYQSSYESWLNQWKIENNFWLLPHIELFVFWLQRVNDFHSSLTTKHKIIHRCELKIWVTLWRQNEWILWPQWRSLQVGHWVWTLPRHTQNWRPGKAAEWRDGTVTHKEWRLIQNKHLWYQKRHNLTFCCCCFTWKVFNMLMKK